ncbi:Vesicle trafficking protein Sly1 (Sec1 family) [Pseudoloma neurophilia]|uniref:Vesicle trafficking protein Sly1 (Sec1 family) n=1 Tax=Pseudoloma neurophilia TaxID=146866 RepID=A0A0R0M3D8_9MICR|nr:Vesicle trafficking protein Sly1 (Sec1 family) [Pseudoloma neurophilia]
MSLITHQRTLVAEILKTSTYSLLILDQYSLTLVNTLFRLIDLRRLNITAILLITDQREAIDAHAIYFINSKYSDIVAEDVNRDLYRSISLNFTDSISRAKLEELAENVSSTGKANTISSVFDRFLTYCAIDSNSFLISDGILLYMKNHILNKQTDNGLTHKNIVNSLFSFFQNNEIEPLMFTNHSLLQKMKNNNFSFKKKAILLFFNRKDDIFAPLMFNWFYLGFVDDLLDFRVNLINYTKDEKENTFNLMWDDDFYIKNKFEKLDVVSDRIEKEHKEYRMKIIEKNRNIPSLTKRSEIIKGHMAIVLAVIDRINELAYDDFYQASENMKKDEIQALTGKGNLELRKRLVALMMRENLSETDVGEFIQNNEMDEKFVDKIAKLQLIAETKSQTPTEDSDEQENLSIGRLQTNSYSNLTHNIFNRVKQSINKFTGNTLLKCKLSMQLDEIIKELKSNGLNLLDKKNKKEICYIENINKIVVVVEGGGCLREMFEIQTLMRNHDVDIVYGCDYMINGNEMIKRIDSMS